MGADYTDSNTSDNTLYNKIIHIGTPVLDMWRKTCLVEASMKYRNILTAQ